MVIDKNDKELLKYGISDIRYITSARTYGLRIVFKFNVGDDFFIDEYHKITYSDIIDELEKNYTEKIKTIRNIKINNIRKK